MPDPELSIIIPCYNCQDTLTEAFRSIDDQNLSVSFEVIMVDDGSTDQTRSLIKQLAEGRPEVKFFFHNQNQGGGATRNTGAHQATSNILFFLDSDDILGEKTLQRMINLMLEKNCDGVGISTSIKFKGKNIKDIAFVNNFGSVGEKIPFTSLLQKPGEPLCSLYSTFMITKRAFNLIGGYPTDHGFDTQGLAWRFLANGLTAYTCPETVYYHRVNFGKSYYLREYEAGKANHNWFKIYEEFLYLFDPVLQRDILQYDLNRLDQSLSDFINRHSRIWHPNVTSRIRENGRNLHDQEIKDGPEINPIDCYWLGTKKIAEGLNSDALVWLKKAKEFGLASPHLDQNLILTGYVFETKAEQEKAERSVKKLLAYQKRGGALFWPIRLVRKINRLTLEKFGKYWQIIKIRWQSSPRKILFIHWLLLRLKKILKIGFTGDCPRASQTKIDIVIPTVTKDQLLLKLVLESLKNLCHPINKIFIVAPASEFIEKFCQENAKCVFVDERSVLSYGKEKINYKVDGLDRSGWLFQQLLKLSGDKFVEMENYLVLDSDTILLNKHSFIIEADKFVLFENEEWHQPYFDSFQKIFGYPVRNRLSFTSHMMIFNVNKLKEMKKEIELKHHQTWDQIYTSTINPQEQSCVSDYDTYGNWLWINYPNQVTRKPLYNKSYPRTISFELDRLTEKYKNGLRSISFHNYCS